MLMKEREVQYFFMNMTWVSYGSISLHQTPPGITYTGFDTYQYIMNMLHHVIVLLLIWMFVMRLKFMSPIGWELRERWGRGGLIPSVILLLQGVIQVRRQMGISMWTIYQLPIAIVIKKESLHPQAKKLVYGHVITSPRCTNSRWTKSTWNGRASCYAKSKIK